MQRVPTTESGGRIHTSAATVAVLPEAEDFDVEIEEKISGSIPIGRKGRVDKVSTLLIVQCELPMCPPMSSCNARMKNHSIRIKQRR